MLNCQPLKFLLRAALRDAQAVPLRQRIVSRRGEDHPIRSGLPNLRLTHQNREFQTPAGLATGFRATLASIASIT
jgi:hypothetical protein